MSVEDLEVASGTATMTKRRVAISVTPEVADMIRASAKRTGKSISEWMTEAAIDKAGFDPNFDPDNDEGLKAARWLVEDYEATYGPIPEEIWQEAREFTESLFVPDESDDPEDAADEPRAATS